MAKAVLAGRRLDRLPLVDEETGDLTVVLETPKASRNKYKYDAGRDVMRLGATLGEGLAFPYDFGFFPSTLGEDGDPLDVLLFLDTAVPPGCVTPTMADFTSAMCSGLTATGSPSLCSNGRSSLVLALRTALRRCG